MLNVYLVKKKKNEKQVFFKLFGYALNMLSWSTQQANKVGNVLWQNKYNTVCNATKIYNVRFVCFGELRLNGKTNRTKRGETWIQNNKIIE